MTVNNFSDYLKERYDEWNPDGGRKSIANWSIHLRVSQPNLSRWMSGKAIPDDENIEKLVSVLGVGVRDALGLARPINDSRLRLVNDAWDRLSDYVRNEIARLASEPQSEVVYPVKEKRKEYGQKTKRSK